MKSRKLFSFILMAAMTITLLPSNLNPSKEATAALNNPILHMKFDDNLNDFSGNGYNGECTYGKITYEKGIFGKSAVFDGKSYIEIEDNDDLDLKDSFTISLWAYKENMKEEYVPYVYKEEDEDSWASPYKLYDHWKNAPGLYLHDGGANSELDQFYIYGSVMDIRKWFLLTVTYDGKEVRLYHNKVLSKKISVTGQLAATIGNLYIGMQDGSVYYKGKMDDLRIYNYAITANDVGSLYEAGLKESPTLLTQTNSLVAHYRFENNFKDSSKLGNHAEKVTGEGSIKYVDAVNGKGAKFSKGSYLEIKDNDSINFDEGFTLTGWICSGKNGDTMTLLNRLGVSTGYSSNDPAYGLQVLSEGYSFFYAPFLSQHDQDESYYRLNNSIKNKWYHIGVTFNGKEVRWYKNGALAYKQELDGIKIAHASGSLMIGSDGEKFFEGIIDELKLYNYALDANKVKEDYIRMDSLSISKANQDSLKALKVKTTVSLQTSRKYYESGESKVLTSGVTYTSSNKKIFTVSNTGKITAVKNGKANLTITHGGISKTYAVTVK